jgi:hypothetical protein
MPQTHDTNDQVTRECNDSSYVMLFSVHGHFVLFYYTNLTGNMQVMRRRGSGCFPGTGRFVQDAEAAENRLGGSMVLMSSSHQHRDAVEDESRVGEGRLVFFKESVFRLCGSNENNICFGRENCLRARINHR